MGSSKPWTVLSYYRPEHRARIAGEWLTTYETPTVERLHRDDVPHMCRTQIGCAVIVPWWAWGRGWQALQVIDS